MIRFAPVASVWDSTPVAVMDTFEMLEKDA